VARVGADCGGATPLPLAGAAVGCAWIAGVAEGGGVGGVDGRLSLSILGALACEFAESGRKHAATMSKMIGWAVEKFFNVQLICANVLSSDLAG
jgi:hypothetical protein